MMNLALGRPALAVVAGALASLINEDDPDDQLNQEAFLNTPAASDQPMLEQFGAFLKAKDEAISALQQQIKTSESNRLTREAICNYEDTCRSRFHFHLDDVGDLLGTYAFLHIRDLEDQQYFEKLDIASDEPEDLSRVISMVTQLCAK